MKRLMAMLLTALAMSAPAQELSLKAGESAELHGVYWVVNCVPIMLAVPTVDIMEGPAGLEITARQGEVEARRQGCGRIPGAILTLHAKSVEANWTGVVKYRVNYKTRDGDRQSSHQRSVALYAR